MKYFITTVTYDKMMNNGAIKSVKEKYLVDAMTFSEAEARITEEMQPYKKGDLKVDAVVKPRIEELFIDGNSDNFYKVVLAFKTIDERTGVENSKNHTYMVQADNLISAYNSIEKEFKNSVTYYEFVSVAKTPIVDYFLYDNKG